MGSVVGELDQHSAQVRFTLSGLPVHKSLHGARFRPDRIEFRYVDGEIWSVTLSGPGVSQDGSPASRRAKSIFGVGGWRLVDLYDWAAELMMQADNYNVRSTAQ